MVKYRLVILGATGTALKRTIPALQHSTVCEVVAIQSRNPDKLKNVAERFSIPRYYLDSDAMLDSEDYDAVFIGTPPFMHLENVQQCLSRGKPTICEKPLARMLAEAQQIAELASDHPDVPFMVAHQMRHQAAVVDIKAIIDAGDIGPVTHVWCQWGYDLNRSARNASWKTDPNLGGGGTFLDNGIHIVDIALALFGSPTRVFGQCITIRLQGIYDNESAMLCYEDKTVILSSSQTMPYAGNHLLIYGLDGKIEAFYAIGEESIKEVHLTGKKVSRTMIYPSENPYRNEIENFFAYHLSRNTNVTCGTSVNEAMQAMKIVERLRESAKLGQSL
jgi:predicted dehydrogenase